MNRRKFLGALSVSPLCPFLITPSNEDRYRRTALFWDSLPEKKVQCTLCPRACRIADMERGYCGVRENIDGEYYTLVYGRVVAAHVDPIEKKPLFHFLPGSTAFSVATAGCNMECKFCQNWDISQFRPEQIKNVDLQPRDVVQRALRTGSTSIAYTYSEPVIFYEYMRDCAEEGQRSGVRSVMISNGYIEAEPMRELLPALDGVKVDLKAFTDSFYRDLCAGTLEPVLDILKLIKERDTWLEIVVLIIPTHNDGADEIKAMSDWIVSELGPDVPVHFTQFHPTYRMRNLPRTPVKTLERCHRIAKDAGLHYVYLGNVPGYGYEDTTCPHCDTPVIKRFGYTILEYRLENGACSECGTVIPGVWV